MKKPIDFSTYKQIQKMTLNDLNRWVVSVYQSGFEDGLSKNDEGLLIELDENQLYELIFSIEEIDSDLARRIVDVIIGGNENGGMDPN